MSSTDVVRRNDRGSRSRVSMQCSMAATRPAAERCAARLICRSVKSAKKRSTWLGHEADVGVKRRRRRGRPTNRSRISLALRPDASSMTIWMSRTTGTGRSTASGKARNSRARCRLMQLAMTAPVAASRAANGVVVPQRLLSPTRGAGDHGIDTLTGSLRSGRKTGAGFSAGTGVSAPENASQIRLDRQQ